MSSCSQMALKLAYNTIEDWSNRGHVCRIGKLGKITVSTNFVSNEKKIEDQVKTWEVSDGMYLSRRESSPSP